MPDNTGRQGRSRRIAGPVLSVFLMASIILACQGNDPVADDSLPPVITKGPASVSIMLSPAPFAKSGETVKADYKDVAATLRYYGEDVMEDIWLYIFDASAQDAYSYDSPTDTYTLNPDKPKLIGSAPVAFNYVYRGGNATGSVRVEFTLADASVKSLVAFAVANVGTVSRPATSAGETFSQVVAKFAAVGFDFNPSVEYGNGSIGIPMAGWKSYGTPAKPLKFYSGISTPLTAEGIDNTVAHYYLTNGRVQDSDLLMLRRALARLHVRYAPDDGQPAIRLDSAKVFCYRNKFKLIPTGFASRTEITPFDVTSDEVGDKISDSIAFRPAKVNAVDKDGSLLLYVPEFNTDLTTPADPLDPKLTNPRLTVWTTRLTDNVIFTYDAEGISVSKMKAGVLESVTYRYGAWAAWVQMRLIDEKEDAEGNKRPAGTLFNLVRNYSYEWKATGIVK